METVQRGPSGGLHRVDLCPAARPRRNPMAVQRRRTGGHRTPVCRRALSDQPGPLRKLRARPGRRSGGHRDPVPRPAGPMGGRSSKPPPTNLPTSCPTPSIPCVTTGRGLPLAHPGPRPDGRRNCSGPRRRCGWKCPARTRTDWVSRKAISCVPPRGGAVSMRRRISNVREGVVFAPWHYGDDAANDLTPPPGIRSPNNLSSKSPPSPSNACEPATARHRRPPTPPRRRPSDGC